jgi:hypothetical protein
MQMYNFHPNELSKDCFHYRVYVCVNILQPKYEKLQIMQLAWMDTTSYKTPQFILNSEHRL